MSEIKVSVCVVTYNHERFIARAVESVLAQETNFPIEIVIGEDFSTDGTANILHTLASQHPQIINLRIAERNQGAKANFLGTIAACRGDYVAMLEGDDYWTCTNKLQSQVDALDAHPEWAICFHPTECVYEDGLQGQSIYPLNWTQPEATIVDLLAANFIPTNSVVFRNRLFVDFPPWFRGLKLGDWPLHILNAAHGKIGFLPQVMSAYRIHRGGIWNGETPAERMAAIFRMFTAVDHHFAGKFAGPIDEYRLNAVRDLMTQLDTSAQSQKRLAEELEQTNREKSRLLFIEGECEKRGQQIAMLEGSNQSLVQQGDLLRTQNQSLCEQHHSLLEQHHSLLEHNQTLFDQLNALLEQYHLVLDQNQTLVDRNQSLVDQNQSLVGQNHSLVDRHHSLFEQHQSLKESYDTWRKTITYRVMREIRRPFNQLRTYVRRRSGAASESQKPDEPQARKVA